MNRMLVAALAIFAMALPAVPAAAQQNVPGARETEDTFDWTGSVPSGSWLRIRDLNGSVRVEPATGNTVEVHAEKEWRRGDPRDVHFVVIKDGDNVTICALWHDDVCDESGYHSHGHHGDDHNDVSVAFTVKLPRGVKINAGTVNGAVEVRGADADVVAHSVNGRVDAFSTRGRVDASTVNGSVRAHMDTPPADVDLDYTTVNGSITLEVPASFSGELEMETVNGSLQSDFPLTLTGRVNPRHLRATIGNGGGRIRLKTVNGSVELRKLS
jgi:hypothetical protein